VGKKAATSAPVPGASVTFLSGTRGPGVKDDFLDMAAKWVAAIKKNVGAGAIVGKLGEAATVATTIDTTGNQAAKENLDTATLDAKLGGLRGHTLVFVTHGLDVDPKAPKDEQLNTQGLLFHNMTVGRSSSDVVMMKMHLDRMKVDNDHVIADVAGLDLTDKETKSFVDDVKAFARVVDALRQAVFQHVYLAACGTKGRLTEFAKLLQTLANVTVFFNTEAIFLSDKDPTFAEVGIKGSGSSFTLSKGLPFFAPTTAATVPLRSGTDTFLPGSMERAP